MAKRSQFSKWTHDGGPLGLPSSKCLEECVRERTCVSGCVLAGVVSGGSRQCVGNVPRASSALVFIKSKGVMALF